MPRCGSMTATLLAFERVTTIERAKRNAGRCGSFLRMVEVLSATWTPSARGDRCLYRSARRLTDNFCSLTGAALTIRSSSPASAPSSSIDMDEGAAVDWQRNAGNEIRLVRSEEKGGVRDVPSCTHLAAQRHARIPGGRDLGPALYTDTGARIDRHQRVHQSGQDDIGPHPEFRILNGDLLSEGDQPGLGRLVGHIGVLLPGGDRRDHG